MIKLQRGKNIYMCYENEYLHELRYSYIPEPRKWYPFRAEPPRIGRCREYPPCCCGGGRNTETVGVEIVGRETTVLKN